MITSSNDIFIVIHVSASQTDIPINVRQRLDKGAGQRCSTKVLDKGARTLASADNDFKKRHEIKSNLQFRITMFVKIAVNQMFFFLLVVSQAKHLKTSLL